MLTLAPGVTLWDSGEFLAAIHALGIPHPPGTPLYVLLGNVWSLLFADLFGFARAINLLSAVCTALGCGILANLFAKWTGDDFGATAAGIVAGLMSTVWMSATETEVYGVALLFGCLILWAGDRAGERSDMRWSLLTAYLAGLAWSLHLTALLVLPSAILLVFTTHDGYFAVPVGRRHVDGRRETHSFAKLMRASIIVAVLGIAGTVGVFIAMLSLARGFKATLVASGSNDNAIVMRAGATSEMMSGIPLEHIKIMQDAPGVARGDAGPLVTSEVVVVAPFPLRSTGTDANVQVRGVSANVLTIRKNTKVAQGRMFEPGLSELVVGKNANTTYSGLTVGNTVDFGGGHWRVVGVFDAGGSAFDSEVWCDARVLDDVYKRPSNVFQSVTVHLTSPDALQQFKDSVTADPRLNVDVSREIDYYSKQSTRMTQLITILGGLVASVMAIGAIFGALNTMYSAVAERGREIATMRALGFGGAAVVFSFLIEALLISFIGGAIGAVAVLPLNGLTTGAMNWQTFSHLAFAFKITPGLLLAGIIFALLMGLFGGLPPAMRAAWRPVAVALREL